MHSSFLGIEIAKKALFTNQRAQQTVSHNVANANTPGYSRQRVILESTFSRYGMGCNWQLGTGVKISDVDRIRDDFTDRQYRNENSSMGQWSIQSDILLQVEAVFNEPSDIGISSVLNDFWKSLETLSTDASSQEARETVKERAITLADTINHAANQLNDIVNDINYRISIKVDEVNSIARQIAQLNLQIRQSEIGGASAADLKDKRDLLLDELSKLVKFEAYEDQNGIFSVNVGGAILVKGTDSAEMVYDDMSGKIYWKEYGSEVNISAGELVGLTELRDEKVKKYMEDLDTFTKTFAEEFNKIHRGGFNLYGEDGIDFFNYNNGTLSVNQDIIDDPLKIAAAQEQDKIPGDNRNVLKLADLRYAKISFNGKESTVDDFYGALVSKIGVDSQEARRAADSQSFMVSQLDERRQMTSSVSLDEEMTKMIQYLHGYNAASRVVTAIDEMLGTVIKSMGITGR